MSSLKGTMINCITSVPFTVCPDTKMEICETFECSGTKVDICEDSFDSKLSDKIEWYGNALKLNQHS